MAVGEGDPVTYRIQNVERSTSPTSSSLSRWMLRFVQVGPTYDPIVIEVTVSSAVFAWLDLDAQFTREEVEALKRE